MAPYWQMKRTLVQGNVGWVLSTYTCNALAPQGRDGHRCLGVTFTPKPQPSEHARPYRPRGPSGGQQQAMDTASNNLDRTASTQNKVHANTRV